MSKPLLDDLGRNVCDHALLGAEIYEYYHEGLQNLVPYDPDKFGSFLSQHALLEKRYNDLILQIDELQANLDAIKPIWKTTDDTVKFMSVLQATLTYHNFLQADTCKKHKLDADK